MREAHDENAPISQPSTLSQKSYVGSKKSDLKSTGGSLDSELSNLNLQDMSDEKCPKDTQEGVAAATAQACGNNNYQGASGVSSEPPNHNSDISSDGITCSQETHTLVPDVPDPTSNDIEVPADPNSEASRDGITHGRQTHTQVPNMPKPANTDGGVPTDSNSEVAGDGTTHGEQTHTQVPNLPEPANNDGGVPVDPNSEAHGDGITHGEAFRNDRNQERNTATTEATEAPNLNQEATVPVTAAETVPLHPDGTNLGSLTSTPIQEESVDTVDEGATSDEAAPSEEAANSYDRLYGKYFDNFE